MARLAVTIVALGAVVAASVFTAGPAEARENYTVLQCADGALYKTSGTFGTDGSGNETITAVRATAGSCEHGPWITLYNNAVAPPPGTGGPLSAEAALAIGPSELVPTDDMCLHPTARGTPGNDVIVLIDSANHIVDADDGNDVIVSLGTGHDVVCGGNGDDVLIGGPGGDTLFGGRGTNVVVGGPDDSAQDVLDGGTVKDASAAGVCAVGDETLDVFAGGCKPAVVGPPSGATTTTGRGSTTTGRRPTTTTRRVTTTTRPVTTTASSTTVTVSSTTSSSTTTSTLLGP